MKKIITLGICLLVLGTVNAQKLDYDNDSKWFFGFNLGGTWNTTDVKNKTHFGWGLTLGRAFNYNYGKKISYDVRLRYLGGNWYGQDYTTTEVTNNEFYNIDGPVNQHYDTSGYTINNFNTEAHELGLELVIHLNGLRERTGFDPYIFGGVGIAWNQTYGDLAYNDSLGKHAYSYSEDGITKQELGQLTDDIYDSALDGSNDTKYNTSFIPSVGIGLAYQVGPKFSIGIEHRTMFFLENTFDGYAGGGTKWGMANDLYHYTGLTLKFHLGRKNRTGNPSPNPNPTPIPDEADGLIDDGCITPAVDITRPNQSAIIVYSNEYQIKAKVKNVDNRDDIQFSVNGNASTNFVFNSNNGNFESTTLLNLGTNEVVLSAENTCGTESETITITYIDCDAPKVRFTRPTSASSSVESAPFVINAIVENANSIVYQVNGVNSSNYLYNATNGTFESSITLQRGMNTIRITVQSECGTEEQVVQINYEDCTTPRVRFTNPSTTTSTVDKAPIVIRAIVEGANSVAYQVNGVNSSNFIFNPSNGSFESSINLRDGQNTIRISAQNDCGVDEQVVTITYTDCLTPFVNIDGNSSSITVDQPSFMIGANIGNIQSQSNIEFRMNGLTESFSFNTGSNRLTSTVTLMAGTNTFLIKAQNECGVDQQTLTVTFAPCLPPSVIFIAPTGNYSTQNPNYTIKTKVLNVANVNEITLKVNNVTISGGSYNASTQIYEHAITLNEGANTVSVEAANQCGNNEQSVIITKRPCLSPTISVIQPTATSTQDNTIMVKVTILNITSASQVSMKVNGVTVVGGTYNVNTHLFQKNITLQEGTNTIALNATNECKTAKKLIKIDYLPCLIPDVSMISPSIVEVSTGQYTIEASITNITGVNQTQLLVNGTVDGGATYSAITSIYTNNISLNQGTNVVNLIVTNSCGTITESITVNRTRPIEDKMTICHHPPGNPENRQELEIPVSAWAAHQAHGDTEGACPEVPVDVKKMTICHHPLGNPENTQELEIPVSAWAAHQAHGDTKGACPEVPVEDKMTICHHPPGNPENTQELEIPVSAWAAHQAHGDTEGACPEVQVESKKITICHHPPGNPENTQELEIPVSAWPAHQAHGDTKGGCPEVPVKDKK
ncbi:MAG: hypothetical protein QNK23_01505 [Crocinitomicaceae bacterium]|nr:hypothetical protein [Crocinitomicaceae bacterium]